MEASPLPSTANVAYLATPETGESREVLRECLPYLDQDFFGCLPAVTEAGLSPGKTRLDGQRLQRT
jgi:hypothetical protein